MGRWLSSLMRAEWGGRAMCPPTALSEALKLTTPHFRPAVSIAECPHKLPYLATLLGLLSNETFVPPPTRAAAKPLVTITNNADGFTVVDNSEKEGDDAQAKAGQDTEMKSETPTTPTAPAAINLGLEIVKHLVKVFQNHLDARRWRSVRFSVSTSHVM